MMRDLGDDSSAGSTPPPPYIDSFSPSYFLVEDEPQSLPTQAAGPTVEDDLWTHLELDGWCFNSDNHHHHHQPQQQYLGPAASEPLRPKTACGSRRPPRPSRGSASVRESTKRKFLEPVHVSHRVQEWDESGGNLNSIFESLASENDKDEVSSTDSDESEVQSDLPPANEKRPPEIGMEFSTEEEAYKFYKKYADEFGFSVRKGKVQRLSNGAIRKRNFLCSKQGYKIRKVSDSNQTMTKYKRKETRTGCNASVQLTVEDGKWLISSFVSEHNHGLEIKPKKDRVGRGNSSDFLPNGASSMIRTEDVQSLMDCFVHLQAKDPLLFYGIQVDPSNRGTNFFWRDSRSRVDYSYFSDVVVFDTTHRVNNVIIASFWGLNHHRQRVSFGCALLLDESVESFMWLFRVFAVAMDDIQPRTLYGTDESRAISTAVAAKFPKTKHRLCASNVFRNAKTRLLRCFEQDGFEESFKKCLLGCHSKEEFELNWDVLLVQFDLLENSWLSDVRKQWENWSHLFRRETFSGGVEEFFETLDSDFTFQNLTSEIMSLPDLVQKHVKEAQKMRLEESNEDLRCHQAVNVRSRKGMEKQAEDLYTRAVFKKFQDELLDSLSLAIEEVTSSATASTFKLTEDGHKKEDIVMFESSNSSVTCSCGKFDTMGILCGHCIKVLNAKNIFQIPLQYVLKRWTKSAKEEFSAEKNQKTPSCYTRNIMHKALDIVTKSIGIEESRNMVEGYLDLALKKAEEILKEKGPDKIGSKSPELEPEDITSCAVHNSVRHLRSKKMITSTSSAILNREQGSKNTMRSHM